MVKLANRISVYVCVASMVPSVARTMSETFGGATCVNSIGYWVDAKGNLIEDRTTIITSYTQSNVTAATVENIVRHIFLSTSEDAVSVETAEGLTIVERADFFVPVAV